MHCVGSSGPVLDNGYDLVGDVWRESSLERDREENGKRVEYPLH
jgi:hypothetical protein